jgi:D-alanyl-D-alanine carboxypeptidase/D-alanyl-D-alanine-endopeptidase (penicillin-binding protein 4)
VIGVPEPARAHAGDEELARVTSPPLSQIVEHTIATSDNEAAEVLARQTAIAAGEPASFEGGATAVLDVIAGLGVPTDGAQVYDGSGLSRDNRLDPDALTAVLEAASAPEHPELRSVVTGLPVAGFTGSLAYRFTQSRDELGRGSVRAKTGTLTGVSGLAGTVLDRTGTPLVFAFLADRIDPVDTLEARATLDAVTSALAACRCS